MIMMLICGIPPSQVFPEHFDYSQNHLAGVFKTGVGGWRGREKKRMDDVRVGEVLAMFWSMALFFIKDYSAKRISNFERDFGGTHDLTATRMSSTT